MALAWEHGVRCSPALCSVQSVSAGAAYKSLVLAAAWVMCSYRGHCTVCSLLQHQSSLLSLKNVWTSECSQVLQSVSQPALQQMQPLQASPGWLHRLLQCCSAADQTSGAGSQSGLSGSTCLMEPAILSGSDHYPALWAATPALSNDQELKNAIDNNKLMSRNSCWYPHFGHLFSLIISFLNIKKICCWHPISKVQDVKKIIWTLNLHLKHFSNSDHCSGQVWAL